MNKKRTCWYSLRHHPCHNLSIIPLSFSLSSFLVLFYAFFEVLITVVPFAFPLPILSSSTPSIRLIDTSSSTIHTVSSAITAKYCTTEKRNQGNTFEQKHINYGKVSRRKNKLKVRMIIGSSPIFLLSIYFFIRTTPRRP